MTYIIFICILSVRAIFLFHHSGIQNRFGEQQAFLLSPPSTQTFQRGKGLDAQQPHERILENKKRLLAFLCYCHDQLNFAYAGEELCCLNIRKYHAWRYIILLCEVFNFRLLEVVFVGHYKLISCDFKFNLIEQCCQGKKKLVRNALNSSSQPIPQKAYQFS